MKRPKNQKWTQETRRLMYKKLLRDFGPYRDWEEKRYPYTDKLQEFKIYMNKLAENLSFITGEDFGENGPLVQFNFGVSTQDQADKTHIMTIMFNKTAAYEVGFITVDEFPKHMIVEHEEN